MKIVFAPIEMPDSGTLVVFLASGNELTEFTKLIDTSTAGAIKRAIDLNSYEAKANTILIIEAPHGLKLNRILLCGLGKISEISTLSLQEAGANAIKNLLSYKEKNITFVLDNIPNIKIDTASAASEIAFGLRVGSYKFTKYFTAAANSIKAEINSATVMTNEYMNAESIFSLRNEVSEGVILARNLISEPGNVKYPEAIGQDILELKNLGVDVQLLKYQDLRDMGMGALLGVSQGSDKKPVVGVMYWEGTRKSPNDRPVALVGKGVTFDTGGISLKPSGGMEEMKYDMAGAGAVIGAMRALAGRKAKCNVVGIVGLVENMPDGKAQRPGDVVTTMSGQTIEVINTDAEGRLVLADVLYYTQTKFNPRIMINLATLTGAVVVTLGSHMAGVFSNNQELADNLVNAGKMVGEDIWKLPLDPRYDKEINSTIADMKNVGKSREAGSIAGAQLLQRFVGNIPWAHIDIAGVAWKKSSDNALVPKGASGFGVKLLDRLIGDYYEN